MLDFLPNKPDLNKDNTLCFKSLPGKIDGTYFVIALVKTDDNLYKTVQITKPQRTADFPLEPATELDRHYGKTFFKDFAILNGQAAINLKYLKEIDYTESATTSKKYSILAKLKNNSYTCLFDYSKKDFKRFGYPTLSQFADKCNLEEKVKELKTMPKLIDEDNIIYYKLIKERVNEKINETKI